MKKGIVMEKSTDHVIVMTKDARFVKLNTTKHAVVGEEIYFFEEDLAVQRRPIGRAVIAAVLAFFLILASVPFVGPYLTPVYAIVSVDINPSLELFLDKQEKVIRYRAYNERAQDVLSKDLVGDSIEEALEQILERVDALAYKEADTPVLIGFTSENEQFREQLSQHLTAFATEKEAYRFALIGTAEAPEKSENSLGKTVLEIEENGEIEKIDKPGLKRIDHGLPQAAVENRERVEEQKAERDAEKAEREAEKAERERQRFEEKQERKEEQEQFVEEKKEAARQKAEAARGKGPKKQYEQEGTEAPEAEAETPVDDQDDVGPQKEDFTPPGQRRQDSESDGPGSSGDQPVEEPENIDDDAGEKPEEKDKDEPGEEKGSEGENESDSGSTWERNRYQFKR